MSISDEISPRRFGAVCDGRHHPIGSPRAAGGLGLRTIAAIVDYRNAAGSRPYAWLRDKVWQPHVAIPLSARAAAGATTLHVDSAAQIPVGAVVTGSGVAKQPPTVARAVVNLPPVSARLLVAVAAGARSLTLDGTRASLDGFIPGARPLPQDGLSFDDQVTRRDGDVVTLQYGATSALAAGTEVRFQAPASIVLSAPLTAAKPALDGPSSTRQANYWIYLSWPLTDTMAAAGEMDFFGQQAAIEQAYRGPTGGLVRAPAGRCVNDNDMAGGNGLGWLFFQDGHLLHEAGVDFVGAGLGATQETWPVELGAGRAMMSFGDPAATWDNGLGRYGQNFYTGRLAELSVVGPSPESNPFGEVRHQTSGILAGARRRLVDVSVREAFVGIAYEGVDHTDWENIETMFNSYGIRMGAASANLYGNDSIRHLETSKNRIANIDLDKDAYWYSDVQGPFYCSDAPYCFRLEPGETDHYGQPTGPQLQNSTFNAILAEGIGNGFIADANAGPDGSGPRRLGIVGTRWTDVMLQAGAASRIAGQPFNDWIDGGSIFGSRFEFQTFGIPLVPGMKSGFFIGSADYNQGGDLITGDLTATLKSFGATPFIRLGSAPYLQQHLAIRLCQQGAWCGHVEIYGGDNSVGQGTPLEYVPGIAGADLSVAPSSGERPFGGINMTAATAPGQPTIVATRFCSQDGGNPVSLPTSGSVHAGDLLRLAPGGTVTAARNPADGTVIGIAAAVLAGRVRANVGPLNSCD